MKLKMDMDIKIMTIWLHGHKKLWIVEYGFFVTYYNTITYELLSFYHFFEFIIYYVKFLSLILIVTNTFVYSKLFEFIIFYIIIVTNFR